MTVLNRPIFIMLGLFMIYIPIDSHLLNLIVNGPGMAIKDTILFTLLSTIPLFINVKINDKILEYRYLIFPIHKVDFYEIKMIDSGWFYIAYSIRFRTTGLLILFISPRSIAKITKIILEKNPYCQISWDVYKKIKKIYKIDYKNNIA